MIAQAGRFYVQMARWTDYPATAFVFQGEAVEHWRLPPYRVNIGEAKDYVGWREYRTRERAERAARRFLRSTGSHERVYF